MEIELSNEQKCVLFELAKKIAENNKREQDAVQGYTEQLQCIARAREVCASLPDVLAQLDELEAATVEKTQDELSHSRDLNIEYTALTDIPPKED